MNRVSISGTVLNRVGRAVLVRTSSILVLAASDVSELDFLFCPLLDSLFVHTVGFRPVCSTKSPCMLSKAMHPSICL